MIIQPRKRTGEYNIEVEQENISYRENRMMQPRERTGEYILKRKKQNPT